MAQVSKSTVSRVLNGTAKVHPEKIRAVEEATRRLGFRPNSLARSLARGKSMTIGVLTQSMGSPFYDTVSQGVIRGLAETGYSAVFADGQWEPNKEARAIEALVGRRVEGLVLIGGDLSGRRIEQITQGLPTVLVARNLSGTEHHCIHLDNVRGGFDATSHLIQQGHQRIAMVKGLVHHQDATDRHRGYLIALKENGIAVDPKLILDGDFTAESGMRAVESLIRDRVVFTAVFAANDIAAFGVRLALDRAGLRVPEDVSIVGFDDQMESAFMTPPLTTVAQPGRLMGQEAAKAVLGLIDGRPFQTLVHHGQLVIRETVFKVL